MGKTRLEAFRDGVMAIPIIVLELKVPHGADLAALRSMLPIFGSYVHATRHIDGQDAKGQISLAAYRSAVPLAFVSGRLAVAIYVAVAALWLVPDPRIERRVAP